MADEKAFSRKPLPANLAADFAAEQARDMFEETQEAEEAPVSPLELPMRSYTQPTEEAEGLPSTLAKLEAEKKREAEMAKTAEQFVGAPTAPGAIPAEAPPEEAARRRARAGKPGAPPTAEQPAAEAISEAAKIGEFAAQKKAESARITAEIERRQSILDAAQKETTEKKRKNLSNLWMYLKGLLPWTGVGFFVAIAMANAQLINRLVFKNYDAVPKPNLPEMSLTACFDFTFCCAFFPIFSCGCLVIMTLIYFIYKFIESFPLIGRIIKAAL